MCVVLQATVVHWLAVRGVVPSLVVIAVVFAAVRMRVTAAVLLGALAGLLEDALGASGGAWTIATCAVAVLASWTTRRFFTDSVSVTLGAVALCTLLRAAIFWSIMSLAGYPPGMGTTHLHGALWDTLYTTFIAAVAIIVRTRWNERTGHITR